VDKFDGRKGGDTLPARRSWEFADRFYQNTRLVKEGQEERDSEKPDEPSPGDLRYRSFNTPVTQGREESVAPQCGSFVRLPAIDLAFEGTEGVAKGFSLAGRADG
jgi:hypothetical protein